MKTFPSIDSFRWAVAHDAAQMCAALGLDPADIKVTGNIACNVLRVKVEPEPICNLRGMVLAKAGLKVRTADEAMLPRVIDGVSAAIEIECRRLMPERTPVTSRRAIVAPLPAV